MDSSLREPELLPREGSVQLVEIELAMRRWGTLRISPSTIGAFQLNGVYLSPLLDFPLLMIVANSDFPVIILSEVGAKGNLVGAVR